MEAGYVEAYARLYREHWWWRVREGILVNKIRDLLKSTAAPARILDVGCGAGVFFDVLAQFGEVEGIESDAAAVEQSGRWRSRIHTGELDEHFTPGHSFDLILMLDVLEHVERPDQVLRRAAELLSPGGQLLVTVPAFNWLWTSHDQLNHHLKRYTASELRVLLERASLAVVETRYLFQSLVVPKLLVRVRERLLPASADLPGIPPRSLNRALQVWYRTENALAGGLPFGSSVLAVARRPEPIFGKPV
jgi:2-polyprenyl-3-methyl-5-hydroxy-6-metoxy-1,4-benzoquinol methylase